MTARGRKTTEHGSYLALIQSFPLRPIRSETDLDRAVAMIDTLSDREQLAPDEQDYLLVLATLIERYEDEHHPVPPLTGAEMLRHLIEAKGVTQAEVASETKIAESTLSEILGGKRGLSAKYMGPLGRYFRIDPGVFVSE
jgi:HTH-type transcriptional regulator / antitoxin HigA